MTSWPLDSSRQESCWTGVDAHADADTCADADADATCHMFTPLFKHPWWFAQKLLLLLENCHHYLIAG
ncbi:hypothetical protein IAQ61_000404 [Plenodomus lingam]|uniref:uncharacterized protein n=1 Tax=Leptosphaeria maculans TaxID=5022 RepID=UPI00332970CB|nr:hypothetical protein IAQ61_000404 [Plenodomus lingam]